MIRKVKMKKLKNLLMKKIRGKKIRMVVLLILLKKRKIPLLLTQTTPLTTKKSYPSKVKTAQAFP